MKLQKTETGIAVIGALDRFHLVKKQQFEFPVLASESVELDLAKAESIDTSGLAWILKCLSNYQDSGKKTSILNPPSQLIALAELSNVLALLPIQKAV